MQNGTYRPDADKVTVKDVCESFLEHCAGRNERDERMTRKTLGQGSNGRHAGGMWI
jgi:hypothetical protein